MHGAWYVGEDFINKIDSKTGQPFGRLGLSWGCPALSLYMAQKVIPVIKNGSLIMHYHSSLQDAALSGKEVRFAIPKPVEVPAELESENDLSGEQGQ